MKQAIADVTAFHHACDVPVLTEPTVPSPERVEIRKKLIREEVNDELLPAMAEHDLPGIADGIADAVYVLIGTALEYGIPLDRVWAAVQAANMAKVDPVTGAVRKREDGKVLKPEGWQPPDIAGVLAGTVESPRMDTYVITANDSIMRVYVGTEEGAEAFTNKLATEYFERQWRHSNRGTYKYMREIMYWTARQTSAVLG